jgi:hypothetical protein
MIGRGEAMVQADLVEVLVAECGWPADTTSATPWEVVSPVSRGLAVLRAESMIGEALPAPLIEVLRTVGDLERCVEVRRGQGGELP